jgi:hypothetical protein
MQILAEEKRTQDAARAAAGPPAPEGGASEALHGAAPPAPAAAAVPSQGGENNVQGSSTEGVQDAADATADSSLSNTIAGRHRLRLLLQVGR